MMTKKQTDQLLERISTAFNDTGAYKRLTAILYACQQELSFSEIETVVAKMEDALSDAIQEVIIDR
jgi:SLT domain-containing protein